MKIKVLKNCKDWTFPKVRGQNFVLWNYGPRHLVLYLNDNNKYEKLKCAHEESIKKSNEMIDEFPDNIDEFIRNSK